MIYNYINKVLSVPTHGALQLYLINNSEFSYKLLFISFVEQFSIEYRKTKTK